MNVYYFWVRNRSTVPTNSVVTRKNSTAFVSNIIDTPERFSYKYYAITDTNKFIVSKIGGLTNSDIILNVDIRTNKFEGDSHSVWKLAKEGDKDWRPGTQIETRWWDSLTGKNEAGDIVPDLG